MEKMSVWKIMFRWFIVTAGFTGSCFAILHLIFDKMPVTTKIYLPYLIITLPSGISECLDTLFMASWMAIMAAFIVDNHKKEEEQEDIIVLFMLMLIPSIFWTLSNSLSVGVFLLLALIAVIRTLKWVFFRKQKLKSFSARWLCCCWSWLKIKASRFWNWLWPIAED